MRIISNRTLKNFYTLNAKYRDSQASFEVWYSEILKANWKNPQEIKAKFGSASILKDSRVVFNIAGNKYRLVVAIDYKRQVCFIKFVGTHKQYDLIDAETYDEYSPHKNRTGLPKQSP